MRATFWRQQHFAGAFGPLASTIVRAQTGGSAAFSLTRMTYAKLARPIWPLDEAVEGRLVVRGMSL